MDREIIYSPMTEADIPHILALQQESGLSYWSDSAYREALKTKDLMVYTAKSEESLIGLASTRLITSEFVLEILNIAVDAKFRREKIGRGLLLYILNNIEGQISKIWLEVREGNLSAIGFYQSQGFRVVGKRVNFYRDPVENALLMQKDLS